mmetsp:Transcript_18866/g.55956  ORF Transcript_18866/g.55956 Transcript_18866/m.55956 type:complete len:1838 (+) Transcript_18866:503-6016(+)
MSESREAKMAEKKAKLAAMRARRAASVEPKDDGPPEPAVEPVSPEAPSPSVEVADTATKPQPSAAAVTSASDKRARLEALKAKRRMMQAAADPASPKKADGEALGRARANTRGSDPGSPEASPRLARRSHVRDVAMLNTTIKNQKAKIEALLENETKQQKRIDALEHELDGKGHELRTARMRASSLSAGSDPTNVDTPATPSKAFLESEAEIARLQKHIEEMTDGHKAKLLTAQQDLDKQQQRADEAAAEVAAMHSQIEQLRNILMSQGSAELPPDWFERLMASSGGAGEVNGGADAAEVAEYQTLLEEAYAELEDLRGASKGRQAMDRSGILSGALDQAEDELAEQNERLQDLERLVVENEKEISKHRRSANNSVTRAEEAESLLVKARKEVDKYKEEVQMLKKALKIARDSVADSKQVSKHFNTEMDTAEAQIAELTALKDDLEQRLFQEVEAAEAEASKLEQELKVAESKAASKELELEHIKQSAVADIEAVKLELMDKEREVLEVRHEAEQASQQAKESENTMEDAIRQLKEDVMAAAGNMKMAGLAGLGLQDMIEKMRDDHATAIAELESNLSSTTEERDRLSAEVEDVGSRLEQREKMLLEIKAFLESQNQGEDEEQEVGDDGEPIGIREMLERTKKAKMDLQAQLSEYEDENCTLSSDLMSMTRKFETTAASERRLQEALENLKMEHADVVAELKETSALLDRVKGFMKSQSGATQEREEDEEDEGGDGEPFANFEHQVQQMLLQNRKLEQEVAKLESDLAREREARARLEEANRCQLDEIDSLNAKVLELADATAIGEKLKEMLEEGEEQRARLREEVEAHLATIAKLEAERDGLEQLLAVAKDELADLRKQLQASITTVDAATLAKLSLMEILEKLKEQHRGEIQALETRIASLQSELDKKDAYVLDLCSMLPDRGEDGTPLEQLRARLESVLQEKAALIDTVQNCEAKIAQQESAVAKLHGHVEQLNAQITQLTETLKSREGDLETFRSGVGRAVKVTRKMLDKYDSVDSGKTDSDGLEGLGVHHTATEAALGRLSDELHEEMGKLRSKSAEHDAALATIAELEQQIADLKAEMAAAEEAANKKLAKQKAEIASLHERFEQLKAQYEEEGRQKDELLNKVRSQLAAAMSKGKDLSNRSTAKICEMQTTITGLQQSLTEAQDTMKLLKEWMRKQALREWQTDDDAAECGGCNVEFSMFNRRHHCRICGQIYCSTCLKHKVMTTAKSKPVKSCQECFSYMGLVQVHETKSDALGAEGKKLKKKEVTVTKVKKSSRFVGTLGFVVDITPEMPPLKGSIVMVKTVKKNGVAEGLLLPGDKIVTVNGVAVADSGEKKVLSALKADSVELVIMTPSADDDDDDGDAAETFDYIVSPVSPQASLSLEVSDDENDAESTRDTGEVSKGAAAAAPAAVEEIDPKDDPLFDDNLNDDDDGLDDGTISAAQLEKFKGASTSGGGGDKGPDEEKNATEIVTVEITRPTLASSFGFGVGVAENGDLLISTVRKGGLGEGAVCLADTIVSIDGKSAADLGHDGVLKIVRENKEVELTLRREKTGPGQSDLESRRFGSITRINPQIGMKVVSRSKSVTKLASRSESPAKSPVKKKSSKDSSDNSRAVTSPTRVSEGSNTVAKTSPLVLAVKAAIQEPASATTRGGGASIEGQLRPSEGSNKISTAPTADLLEDDDPLDLLAGSPGRRLSSSKAPNGSASKAQLDAADGSLSAKGKVTVSKQTAKASESGKRAVRASSPAKGPRTSSRVKGSSESKAAQAAPPQAGSTASSKAEAKSGAADVGSKDAGKPPASSPPPAATAAAPKQRKASSSVSADLFDSDSD